MPKEAHPPTVCIFRFVKFIQKAVAFNLNQGVENAQLKNGRGRGPFWQVHRPHVDRESKSTAKGTDLAGDRRVEPLQGFDSRG